MYLIYYTLIYIYIYIFTLTLLGWIKWSDNEDEDEGDDEERDDNTCLLHMSTFPHFHALTCFKQTK